MKKLFNNSTKGNDTQNQSSKSKRKFLKTFSFSSLALLMGIAGTMAFAPLGVSPSIAKASEMVESTTEQGLITPKADDPVIYTTESGLEIKWGNYPYTVTNGNQIGQAESSGSSLGSGNLAGFPYFVTNDGTTDYTWVIIGKASDVGTSIGSNVLSSDIKYDTLTNWKTNNTVTNGFAQYYYFFNNIYEETTPAATALKSDNLLNDTSAWRGGINIPITLNSSVKTDTTGEIPSGCVLCLANDNIKTGIFATVSRSGSGSSSSYYTYRPSTLTMNNEFESYYTNGSLGLGVIKGNIAVIPGLISKVSDSSTITKDTHVFGLSCGNSGEQFIYSTYLTAAQAKLSANWWLRSNAGGFTGDHGGNNYARSIYLRYINTSGAIANSSCSGNPGGGGGGTAPQAGYRPAFCLEVV